MGDIQRNNNGHPSSTCPFISHNPICYGFGQTSMSSTFNTSIPFGFGFISASNINSNVNSNVNSNYNIHSGVIQHTISKTIC